MSQARRRAKAIARQKAAREHQRRNSVKVSPCINCGQPGPHYVPPSLGEPGFFACGVRTTTPEQRAGIISGWKFS